MAEVAITVREESDIATARRAARSAALSLGMDKYEVAEIEISVSELATNLMRHAGGGTIAVEQIEREGRAGLQIVSSDKGPGITDIPRAMQEGYSTGGTMGSGLPSVKRMMDEMEITSPSGKGTTIVAVKWIKTN